MSALGQPIDERLLLGFETSDDAAVYQVSEELALVLTVDFFTPPVDDPFDFGRIAAANALSDIYAMGATPLLALNLLALNPGLGPDLASDILKGGASALAEANALIAGGHTISDKEPKYGLCVLGTVHPNKLIRNQGAQVGDMLYLTKPLGTGIMLSAVSAGKESAACITEVIQSMKELNAAQAKAMQGVGAHAATDVTGYGLAGHLHEMLVASNCSAVLDWSQIPLFAQALEYSRQHCRPGGASKIIDYATAFVEQGSLSNTEYDARMGVLCDPQTSGGLLIALSAEKQERFEEHYRLLTGKEASCIGTISEGKAGSMSFLDV